MSPPGREEEAPADRPRPPRDTLWALVPRRNLVSAVVLLLVLVAVIVLRHRAGALARAFGEALLGAPPATAPRTREPPRVRLAPPVPPR